MTSRSLVLRMRSYDMEVIKTFEDLELSLNYQRSGIICNSQDFSSAWGSSN